MKKMKKEENKSKKERRFKIPKITVSLAIILVAMVAFFGVYSQKQNQMVNQVKDYAYAMDIKGTRVITFQVKEGNNTVIKDQQGNEITEDLTDEEITQNGYTKEEIPYNAQEILTLENYKKAKKVMEKRLQVLGVEDYAVNLSETTGQLTVQVPENADTDYIVSVINQVGEFELVDSETKEILMTNQDIKEAKVLYSTTETGTRVHLSIQFTKEGKGKFKDITTNYTNTVTENNTTTENVTEEADEVENNTTETTTTAKKVSLKIDGNELTSLHFDEVIQDGLLQLSLGTTSTDNETVQNYAKQAQQYACPMDSGKLPIQYGIQTNEFVHSDITNQHLQMVAIGIAIVAIVGMIIWIVKYKMNGLFAGIAFLGFAAVYMLLLRYTNVILSIEGIFGIGMILIFNYIFLNGLLKNIKDQVENAMKNTYEQFFVKMIPVMIMAIAFCFMKWIPISSFGMVIFWGFLLIAMYHGIITNVLVKAKTEE